MIFLVNSAIILFLQSQSRDFGTVTQLVEWQTENLLVGGSSPSCTTPKFESLPYGGLFLLPYR
jgi:hypothetical protein